MRARTLECNPERLRRLLDEDLSEHEEAEVESHLGHCESCQRTIEEISGGTRLWSDAMRIKDLGRSACTRQGLDTDWNAFDGKDENPSLDFLAPGDRPDVLGLLGSYEVHRVIGRGGMGLVLQAFDPALNRMVAIKVLAPELATSANARRRFAREAQATAAIAHDHIVAIYAVEARSRLPYLVMQYIPGQSLQDRIDKEGALADKAILRIALQAASGLAAAHAQGLVHRDIKPSNILLENGVERVKITDFGLARAIDDASLTQSGIVAGTPQYMSPEQTRGAAIDYRADLFSLGSVIYAMCTGHSPFRAETTMGVLRRVSDDTPRPIREINPDIPEWLEAIVAKLHAKDPADRFQSAGEVAELFGRCLAYAEQPRGKTVPFTSTTHKRARKTKRRLQVAVALSLLLLAGLGAGEATGVAKVTDLVATVFRVRTAQGTLIVQVDDPDINVTVDGEEIVIAGAGPHEIHLRPGKHELKASKSGGPERIQMVEIVSGGSRPIKVDFKPRAMPDVRPKPLTESTNQGALRARLAAIESELAGIERLITQSIIKPNDVQLQRWLKTLETKMAELDRTQQGLASKNAPAPDRSANEGSLDQSLLKQTEDAIARADWARRMMLKGYVSRKAFEEEKARLRSLQDRLGKLRKKAGGDYHKQPVQGDTRERVLPAAPSLPIPAPDDPAPKPESTPRPDVIVPPAETSGPQPKATLRGLVPRRIWALAFSPDGEILGTVAGVPQQVLKESSDDRGELALWRVESGHVLFIPHPWPLRALAFSPDGRTLVTAGSGEIINLREPRTGEVRQIIKGNEHGVSRLAFSRDGNTLASAGLDGTARLWKLQSEHQAHLPLISRVFQSKVESVYALTFMPSGKAILGAEHDQAASLWDLSTGTRRLVFKGHSGPIACGAASPDGKILVTASRDGLVKVWDAATGIARASLAGHTNAVLGAALSPKSKLLATCAANWGTAEIGPWTGEIKIWDMATMSERVTLRGQHTDRVFSVAFSPDGRTLASASWDSTVKLWDVNSLIQASAKPGRVAPPSPGASSDGAPNESLIPPDRPLPEVTEEGRPATPSTQ